MPMTQAEKSRRYREKLKSTNPEKYLELKNKNKERAIKAYKLKLQKKNTIKSTSSEPPANKKYNTESHSNEKNRETQNILAAQVPNIPDNNEMEIKSKMYLKRTAMRNIQRNIEKKMRREINQVREHVQKLMRGYNSLKRDMRKLKSDYQDLEKKVMEKEVETEIHPIEQEQANTPYKRSENFISEHLTNVATPVKETIKKKILAYNVLTDSIKSKFKTCQNKDKNTLKDIVDNSIVKKYKLKTCLTKCLGLKNNLKRQRGGKAKTHNLIETIRKFYERDDVSRASAGKKECRTYKKVKMQVRYLLDTLETLHKKYVSEVGSISLSTFKKYRPFYVVSPNLKDLETCGCLKHSNMQFIVNALKSAGVLKSNNINTILANLVCDPHFRQCMYGECSVCKDNDVQVNREENVEIKWFSWTATEHEYDEKGERKKTKRMAKTENKGTLKDLVDFFNKEIIKFKIHVYNMHHQYQQYKLCIESLDYSECAIHIDFSENWVCKHHEEVQAMHFGASKRQITLHTGVLYIKNEKPSSFCTISADNSHNPEAIWAHLDPVLKLIRLTYPTIETVHFFSDGPTSQYRQKKNFFFITRYPYEYGFKNITWSYFEASHGKGAADGVGGTIKRTLDFKVSHGTDIPDAQTAFHVLQETATCIKIFFIESKIQPLDTTIAKKLTPIRNTLKIHQIISSSKFILKHRMLSCFCKKLKGNCECFCPETHSFTHTQDMQTTLDFELEYLSYDMDMDIDETNIDVNILTDSVILNAMEFEENDTAEKHNYVEKDNEGMIYSPDSLIRSCIKVINNHSILSDQNTTAQLLDVCALNKISKGDVSQNLPFRAMNDNDLPTCLQPVSPSKLSANKPKVTILSNVKIDLADLACEVKKCDIKKIRKGAEVNRQPAETKIVLKKKDMNVKQNHANTYNEDASTSNEVHSKRNQKNVTTETTNCEKNVEIYINDTETSKSSMLKETDSKRKRKNITTETIIRCRKKSKKNTNSGEKSSKRTVKKRKIRTYIESSSENSDVLSLAHTNNSEHGTFKDFSTSCLEDQVGNENFEPVTPFDLSDIAYSTCVDDLLKKDDWIVAKFATKKSLKHFVGRVICIKNKIPTVKFVRKVKNIKGSSNGLIFTYPNVEDVCEMQLNDVIKVLPQPNISRRGQIIFETDISHYNVQ